jgi:4-amino-4-deoxy-L-arabinose transferase-like glycosyltransferase
MPAVNPVKRRDLIALLLVLFIAALMRLGEPGVIEYLHDESYLSLLAQDALARRNLPLLGINSSVGIPNPPAGVYVMMIAYTLSSNPLFATLFIAALNVMGVGLLWLIVHRYLNRTVALVAGLTYALNPWAIFYSRKIWAQDFHTPFILLAFLLGFLGFREGKRWAQILCLPVLVFALQIHFAAWALFPVYVWFLWVRRKHGRVLNLTPLRQRLVGWWPVCLSVVLALLTFVPYYIGIQQVLADDPWPIYNAFDRTSGRELALSPDALTYNSWLITGLRLETWVAPEQKREFLEAVPPLTGLWTVIGGAAVVGLGAVWLRKWRYFAPFVTLWAVVPVLIFTPTWTDIYVHYFVASIPVLCLLAGIGVVWLADIIPGKPISRAGILAGFAVILITQGIWWRGMLRYLDTTYTEEGFGTPIHYLMNVRNAVEDYRDVIVLTDGFDVRYDREASTWPTMLHGKADCVRALEGDGVAVFPNHPFAVIVAPNAPENPVNNIYQTDNASVISLRPGEGEYLVHRFEVAPDWYAPELIDITPAHFDNGVQLTGYHLDLERLYLQWLLPGQTSEDYHYFAHFLDANGEKLGQKDNILWPGRFWCGGDQLVTWADIDLPEDIVTLRVGLYVIQNRFFYNSNLLDEANNPAGLWVDIPLSDEG